jgi:hypothetical protein
MFTKDFALDELHAQKLHLKITAVSADYDYHYMCTQKLRTGKLRRT